jgi:hypothetical protein
MTQVFSDALVSDVQRAQASATLRSLAQRVANGNGRSALAETIIRSIEPGRLTLDTFGIFMDVRQFNPGDDAKITIRRGKYPVRAMVPGTSHLVDRVYKQEKVGFMWDALIAGARANMLELNNGDIDSVARLRRDLRDDLIDAIAAKVFTLLTTTWSTVSTTSHVATVSGALNKTTLDTMFDTVIDYAGSVRAIIGTYKALRPLYQFAGYQLVPLTGGGETALPLRQLQERMDTNAVSIYRGTPVVELRQQYRNALPNPRAGLIPDNVVLVVGNRAGTIGLMGGVEYQDYTDFTKQPADYVIHAWQQYGILIDDPTAIGVITITP